MEPSSLYYPVTADGWQLELKHYRDPDAFQAERAPLVFIPGYGMNTFILAHHPSASSMVESLCAAGWDVWTANLRGQGDARRVGGPRRITFNELANVDIPRVLDEVCARTGQAQVVLAGCSLGASLVYAYLAHHPRAHRVQAVVAIGGPLRWESRHRLVELAAKSPRLLGRLPILGTRRLVAAGLPWVRRLPFLLSIYMNASHIDLSDAATLARTVDDPTPYLNMQIARWVQARDLVVAGVNVSEALAGVQGVDLLCVIGNKDGIVPPDTALSVLDYLPAGRKDVIVAGDERLWFSHADLFISEHAPALVFAPMVAWLAQLGEAASSAAHEEE